MTEPTPLSPSSPPAADSQSHVDAAASSLQVRHGTLPRIRPAPRAESASEAATNDISSVGAMAPGSSTETPANVEPATTIRGPMTYLAARQQSRAATATAQAVQPLHRLLSQFDAPKRIRFSGISMMVFYILTMVVWPSVFVSLLGAATGVIGYLSCSRPYKVERIMWVYVYHWMNVVMMLLIWWTAVDELAVHSDEATSVSVAFIYQAIFILLGTVLHARTLSATTALIRRCEMRELLAQVAWPERWRRRRQAEAAPDAAEPEPFVEPRPSSLSGEDRESSSSSNSSSVHSFELDIEWHQERRLGRVVSRGDVPESPLASPILSPSPVTSYKRIDESSQ